MTSATESNVEPDNYVASDGLVLPTWAAGPLYRFVLDLMSIHELLELSCAGISQTRAAPQLTKLLHKLSHASKVKDEKTQHLARVEKLAALAEKEVQNDFPLLHAMSVVLLWSLLESFIRSYAAIWLEHTPRVFLSDQFQKLKVSIGEYESLEKEQRAMFLVEALERDLKIPLRFGIGRLEALVEPFGLNGEVSNDLSRNLYELQKVRNLIAHRRGVVDHTFVKSCPWMNAVAGERLKVGSVEYSRYYRDVIDYIGLIIGRVRVKFGAASPALPDTLEPTKTIIIPSVQS